MFDFLKQAKEMQGKIKGLKEEMAREEYVGEAGGVSIRISGDMEVKDVKVDPRVNINTIAILIKDAASIAMRDAKQAAAKKLGKITGGLNIPGLF